MTTFVLRPDNARDRMSAAWEFAKSILQFGKPARVTVEEAHSVRTLEQNDKLHAIAHELSKTTKWAGKYRTTEDWKRLLVDAWARAERKSQCEIVPSLDGTGVVNLGIQTRRMRVGDMSELIEFAQAWCVDHCEESAT